MIGMADRLLADVPKQFDSALGDGGLIDDDGPALSTRGGLAERCRDAIRRSIANSLIARVDDYIGQCVVGFRHDLNRRSPILRAVVKERDVFRALLKKA